MTAILIVEDDVLANEHLEFILQQAGYEVLSATSADEAAELLEDREDVQFLVTDVNLPGTMNGLSLAALVKARRPAMNIIIVTGVYVARRRTRNRAFRQAGRLSRNARLGWDAWGNETKQTDTVLALPRPARSSTEAKPAVR
jgi:two-component system, response regulator PdtaR